jgi:protein SCO1/2
LINRPNNAWHLTPSSEIRIPMANTHRMRSRLTIVIAMTTVFVASLLASRYVYMPAAVVYGSAVTRQTATILVPPRALPDFHLLDQAGRRVTKIDLSGHWTLVFMGFTSCSDVCPTVLYTLSETVRKLATPPNVLFVSVDPERDSPAVIDAYLRGFNDSFSGATGNDEQLRELADGLGVSYQVSKDDGLYTVEHSSAVFLLDPATRYHALFSAPHDADAMARDLAQIMANWTARTKDRTPGPL